ncbi:MAG: carboxylesterase family protein, partial [Spongiibacteraceae bacterium]
MMSLSKAILRSAAVSLSLLSATLATSVAYAVPPSRDPTVVQIGQGKLAGAIDPEHEVLSFKGIPYAKPPVGELRWRAPVTAPGWSGVRQATSFGNICPQGSVDIGSGGTATTAGSEDCLYLNVYTPVKITRRGNVVTPQARPVMVWIHGGAWVAGTGNTFDPSVLAPKGDVVVVTINYRFGPLAYLAQRDLFAQSPDAGAGSLATLDQILALKWVRNNIREFGGNPENVTIFGLSGGGFSVCSLMLAPQAAGLFDRGISQSGPCVSPSAYKTLNAALTTGDQFTATLGC